MAIGFSPKHIHEFPLDNLSHDQFFILALEAARTLNWKIGYTSETGFRAFTSFSMSSWSEEITVKIDNGFATLKSECTGSQLIDWGKNKKNIEKLLTTIEELTTTISAAEMAEQYETLKPELASGELDLLNQPPPTTKENIESIFGIFIPAKGYFITPLIIDLNIIIFILMAISGVNILFPDTESLIRWGANFRPVTLEGEWWRLITCCFLHIGIIHLLLNMYALMYIGLLLEPYLGRTRFLGAYLLTGIAASITSLWWHDLTVSAGASGAVFGMYGVFLAMLTTNLIEKTARQALLTSIVVFVGYNLVNGLKGGIDNAAHIGGLISGMVIGYAFIPGLKKPDAGKLKYGVIGIMTVLILASAYTVYSRIPNDIGLYEKRMKSFATMEEKALKVYQMTDTTPRELMLSTIRDTGIYYMNENINLVRELDRLNLPEHVHERNRLLLDYCDLRIKSMNFLYKTIDEDSQLYLDSIRLYNQDIEKIFKQLTGK